MKHRLLAACLGFTLTFGSAWCQEPGLVAHYPLDEGAGEVAHDLSPTASDGRIVGAVWEKQGRGWVLRFDGVKAHVDGGAAAATNPGSALTLSAWVLPEEVPDGEVGICGKHFTRYLLSYYRNVHCYWYIQSGGNNAKAVLSTGVWNHVAGTFDGTLMRLYINGELAYERRSQAPAAPAGGKFYIGCVVGDPNAADFNYQQSGFFKGCIADVRLYNRALPAEEVSRQYQATTQSRFTEAETGLTRLRCRQTVKADGLRLGASAGGAVQIEANGTFVVLESSFSHPGDTIGWNGFAESAERAEPAWQPAIEKTGKRSLQVRAGGSAYGLARTVSIVDGRIEVSDTLVNPGTEPVGVLIRNRISLPKTVTRTRVGVHPCDPLVFAATPGLDVGVLAEDDVSRAQIAAFCRGSAVGFNLGHIGLAPGATRTLKWLVYVLPPTGDAFALINRIRREFGVNHTIPGPGSFLNATDSMLDDPARLKRHLARRPLGVAMLSPWLDYDPGNMSYTLPRPEYKALMQKAYRALKAADPRMKVIGCIETDWVAIYPDRIPGGDKLPRPGSGATGSAYLNSETAKLLADARLPWLDSLKLDRQGRPVLELYTRGGKPQWALGVYPAPGNYQARFLMEQAKFLCEDVGLDGWYIDEFSLYWIKTYDRWDGCTVDIDPATGRIANRYTDANLAGAGPRLDLCNYAVRNHRLMVCNTYATTLAEARLPVVRFAETWSSFDPPALPKTGKPPYFSELASSQLGTMVGLGANGLNLKVASAELLMRALVTYLRHGMVYYHYFYGDLPETGDGSGEYGPINHMFPLTPVRLFEGGIEGQERTITAVAGTYAWNRPGQPVVRVFGPDGRPVAAAPRLTQVKAGWTVALRLNDWSEIAVIEGE